MWFWRCFVYSNWSLSLNFGFEEVDMFAQCSSVYPLNTNGIVIGSKFKQNEKALDLWLSAFWTYKISMPSSHSLDTHFSLEREWPKQTELEWDRIFSIFSLSLVLVFSRKCRHIFLSCCCVCLTFGKRKFYRKTLKWV